MSIVDFPLPTNDSSTSPVSAPPASALRVRQVEALGSQIIALSGRLASATCRWLLLVAEFDATDGADAYGLATTSRWLSHHCGISARTARDHVRVARTLATYPTLAASMSAGRISYSAARMIASTVTGEEPELVHDLVSLAEHATVHQLQDTLLGLRSIDRQVEDPIRASLIEATGERLSMAWDSDARRRVSARLDPEHGALFEAALAAVQGAAPDGERLTAAQALVRMAQITLAALADSSAPPRLPRGHEHAALVLHLHAVHAPDQPPTQDVRPTQTQGAGADPSHPASPRASAPQPDPGLPGGSRASEPRAQSGSREPHAGGPVPLARLHHGPGLPGHVLDRLTCACRVRVVVHDPKHPENVLDLGRSQRLVSDKQYRALLIRDRGHCAHPGCTSTAYLEAHHVRHWLQGGPTDTDNLILLCGHHHLAHHRGEFTITASRHGRFRFNHNGIHLRQHDDPAALFDTDTLLEDEHDHVAADAAGNRWDGYRMERSYATSALAVPRYRARDARRTAARAS
jgi:hypothetical protein